jgi:hypothetical protein
MVRNSPRRLECAHVFLEDRFLCRECPRLEASLKAADKALGGKHQRRVLEEQWSVTTESTRCGRTCRSATGLADTG